MGTNPGVQSDRLLTARVDVPAELRTQDQVSPTARAIVQAVSQVPGVVDARLWTPHVPAQAVWHTSVGVRSRPDLQESSDMPSVRIHQVGSRRRDPTRSRVRARPRLHRGRRDQWS